MTEYITAADIAALTGWHVNTVRRKLKAGWLKAVKAGQGDAYRVSPVRYNNWARQHMMPTVDHIGRLGIKDRVRSGELSAADALAMVPHGTDTHRWLQRRIEP